MLAYSVREHNKASQDHLEKREKKKKKNGGGDEKIF